ncbi:MAG: YetF domain-containing protein [Chthonomonadales bacterium]
MIAWLSEVFSHPTWIGALIISGKTIIVYLFLVGGLRLLGKRELGQMTIYDLVLMIVLANAVQNAMVRNDSSLVGGLVAGLTLLVINRLFSLLLARSSAMERLMVGEPVLILSGGKPLKKKMEAEGVTYDELLTALREHGLTRPEDAEMCVLEVDGSISVVAVGNTVHRSRRHYRAVRLP